MQCSSVVCDGSSGKCIRVVPDCFVSPRFIASCIIKILSFVFSISIRKGKGKEKSVIKLLIFYYYFASSYAKVGCEKTLVLAPKVLAQKDDVGI